MASQVARFSLPAALAALVGASALVGFAELPSLTTYEVSGRTFEITPVKLVIGSLIVAFASLELSSALDGLALPSKNLPLGGLVSGFFGGLSGNQGAFRSAFLIKACVAGGKGGAIVGADCARQAKVLEGSFEHREGELRTR
jgi:hypothetical protein